MLAILLPPYGPNQCPKTECLSLNIQLPIVTTGGHWFYIQQPLWTAHMEKQPLYLLSLEGISIVQPHTDYVYIVCSCDRCCLLFTLNCSYAAGLLCSAGTITPELKQWMMNALVTFTPDRITAKVQSHSRNMGLISILWDKPLTHSLTYFPHSVCPLLNTDYPPSVMWMLCRPVFLWSSVRPNAATVPICRP